MAVSRRQIALVADTTGSMQPCSRQVRQRMRELVRWLKSVDPGVEIAVILHGDYCDYGHGDHTYLTRILNFTDDEEALQRFLDTDTGSGGGDLPEAYEYVLWKAHTELRWATGPNTRRLMVMFGDDEPHPPKYIESYRIPGAPSSLDWREQTTALLEREVSVYTIQCLGIRRATKFWSEVARMTGGHHLELDQFTTAVEFIKAVFLSAQEGGEAQVQAFAEELQTQGKMSRNLATQFSKLSGGAYKPAERYTASTGALIPCPIGRFQVMHVDRDIPISEFVRGNGIPFIIGRGFYEFMKSETIQERKEVIVQRRDTGDLFEGDAAREIIGLPRGMRATVKPTREMLRDYRIFVQSTSPNRKLIGGTSFLYEVDKTR